MCHGWVAHFWVQVLGAHMCFGLSLPWQCRQAPWWHCHSIMVWWWSKSKAKVGFFQSDWLRFDCSLHLPLSFSPQALVTAADQNGYLTTPFSSLPSNYCSSDLSCPVLSLCDAIDSSITIAAYRLVWVLFTNYNLLRSQISPLAKWTLHWSLVFWSTMAWSVDVCAYDVVTVELLITSSC